MADPRNTADQTIATTLECAGSCGIPTCLAVQDMLRKEQERRQFLLQKSKEDK